MPLVDFLSTWHAHVRPRRSRASSGAPVTRVTQRRCLTRLVEAQPPRNVLDRPLVARLA